MKMPVHINPCSMCGGPGMYAGAGQKGGVVCLKCGNVGPGFKFPSETGKLKAIFLWNKENPPRDEPFSQRHGNGR